MVLLLLAKGLLFLNSFIHLEFGKDHIGDAADDRYEIEDVPAVFEIVLQRKQESKMAAASFRGSSRQYVCCPKPLKRQLNHLCPLIGLTLFNNRYVRTADKMYSFDSQPTHKAGKL